MLVGLTRKAAARIGKMQLMEVPSPSRMLELIAALPAAEPVLSRLHLGLAVYLVGGAVRDLLRGETPLDLDLVVEGEPLELARRLGGHVRSYDRFGTCTVSLEGAVFDLAQSRRERYAHPGALPDVEPAPLAEDLLRRDFTVNTFAVALNGPSAGSLASVPQAPADLDAGLLRVLHERSFEDDPTRLLRLARYAARLGFEPSRDTAELAEAAVSAGALGTLSGDRVGNELRLLTRERDPVEAFVWLGELGLDAAMVPRFGLRDPALARRALELLPAGGRADLLVTGVAGMGVPERELGRLLDWLAFQAPDRKVVIAAATGAAELARALRGAGRPADIAAAVGRMPMEAVALAGALGACEQARAWLERLRHVRLEISGDDLLATGLDPGPALGRGLRAALAAKLDGAVAGREDELRVALAAARDALG
ncbi:MAG TPA: hypothetical protein VKT31_06200 [Solirubrobacteraceae bacterium]|nr:hypothetical protein [Solirubrobacteraceae bacterium]